MRGSFDLMIKKLSLVLSLAFLVVCIDQLTKVYIQTQFGLHESLSLIDNLFSLTYARNYGAAFGFLEQMTPLFRDTFMLSIPPLACMIILTLVYFIQTDTPELFNKNKLQLAALGLILGGAIGNYLDRLLYGYVVDFIDFYFIRYHFPTFNIADSSIVIGVVVLIYALYKEKTHVANY